MPVAIAVVASGHVVDIDRRQSGPEQLGKVKAAGKPIHVDHHAVGVPSPVDPAWVVEMAVLKGKLIKKVLVVHKNQRVTVTEDRPKDR